MCVEVKGIPSLPFRSLPWVQATFSWALSSVTEFSGYPNDADLQGDSIHLNSVEHWVRPELSAQLNLGEWSHPASPHHWDTHWILWLNSPCKRTCYEASTISRPLKNIGLFCKRALQKRLYSAKETYFLKGPTNRSHPISRVPFILAPILLFSGPEGTQI